MALKMSLKIDYKKYLNIAIQFISKWQVTIVSIVVFMILSLVVFRINALSKVEANEDRFSEQLTELRKVKIETDAIKRIEELTDTKIDITSDFLNNRDNPFAE